MTLETPVIHTVSDLETAIGDYKHGMYSDSEFIKVLRTLTKKVEYLTSQDISAMKIIEGQMNLINESIRKMGKHNDEKYCELCDSVLGDGHDCDNCCFCGTDGSMVWEEPK